MDALNGLSSEEQAFYQAIQAKLVEKMCTTSPDTPLSKVLRDAIDTYSNLHWILEVNDKKSLIKRADYEKMEFTFGPDLTALPRTRFAGIKHTASKSKSKPKSTDSAPRKLSGMNLFMKENAGKVKFQEAAKMWKELSADEKAKFNERAKNM